MTKKVKKKSKKILAVSTDKIAQAITQRLVLWVSLLAMLALFVSLFRADFKAPQKMVTQKIDIKNKINICLPDDPEELENDELIEKSE